jgi:hypothetical protein
VVSGAIVEEPAASVEVEAALVAVVCGGSASGAGEQARTTASTNGRSLDAVIRSSHTTSTQNTVTAESVALAE